MKTFREFIKEAELPKGIKLKHVQMSDYSDADGLPVLSAKDDEFWSEYITTVKDWTGSANDSNASFLLKHRNRVPSSFLKGGTFYRGFKFSSKQFYDLFKIIENEKVEGRGIIESWTTNLMIAKRFSDNLDKGVGFVVSNRIPSNRVVLNLRDWALARSTVKLGAAATKDRFSSMLLAEAEFEVLVKSGTIPYNKNSVVFAHIDGKEVSFSALNNAIRARVE